MEYPSRALSVVLLFIIEVFVIFGFALDLVWFVGLEFSALVSMTVIGVIAVYGVTPMLLLFQRKKTGEWGFDLKNKREITKESIAQQRIQQVASRLKDLNLLVKRDFYE